MVRFRVFPQMKRSPALVPLSRDHHLALVVARDLSRVNETDAKAAAARFVQFLSQHQLAHFELEERELLPAIPQEEPGPELARRVREDHEYLRAAMLRLRGSPGAADVEFVHEVGARLRAHVEMEECELFPYLERSLDAASLDQLGARLAHQSGEQPVAVVRGFLDAVIARDLETILALADPRIELHPLRLTATLAYAGHEGIRRWLDDLAQRAAQVSFQVREIRGLDEQRAMARVQLRASGEELASVTAVFSVRAGKVKEVHGYFSDEDLLVEVGHI